jgi:hypothetical protein
LLKSRLAETAAWKSWKRPIQGEKLFLALFFTHTEERSTSPVSN